ncbi:MAG: hypothetical protein QCI38_01950, partial [Candidatus Thermoplasmatota archaeon]|nr:hypothetical protein [Candidatus Thermoplasmatota archaeon]
MHMGKDNVNSCKKHELGIIAVEMMKKKEYAQAASALEKIDPNIRKESDWLNMLTCLRKCGDNRKAYEEAAKAEKMIGACTEIQFHRAKILSAWGKNRLALHCCEAMLANNPISKEGWELYIAISRELGELERSGWAGLCLLEAVEGDKTALKEAAEYSIRRGEHTLGMEYSRRMLSMEPKSPMAWALLSESFMLAGKWDRALCFVDRALCLNKKFPRAWITKG